MVRSRRMPPQKEQEDLLFDLINAFALVKTPEESAKLIRDLLSGYEVKNLSRRLRISKLILAGKLHEEIVNELRCSYATVAKVNAWLDRAGEGLRSIVSKLPKRKERLTMSRGYYGYEPIQALLTDVLNFMEEKETKKLKKMLSEVGNKDELYRDIQRLVEERYRHGVGGRKIDHIDVE